MEAPQTEWFENATTTTTGLAIKYKANEMPMIRIENGVMKTPLFLCQTLQDNQKTEVI